MAQIGFFTQDPKEFNCGSFYKLLLTMMFYKNSRHIFQRGSMVCCIMEQLHTVVFIFQTESVVQSQR